jgi:hypothetical protein
VNERIVALRAHLELCERVQQLLAQERSHLEGEGEGDGWLGASSLADQRKMLLEELQTSLEQLRRSETTMAQTDPVLQAECSRLILVAREVTLAVLEGQNEVESLLLSKSLRRPNLDTPATAAAPVTAARLYLQASAPIPEKPFDSRVT